MRVNVWTYDQFDFAALAEASCYNFFMVKDPDIDIKRESITVGVQVFSPGDHFNKIGKDGFTSAGFVKFHLIDPDDSIRYYGFFEQYLLFEFYHKGKKVTFSPFQDYVQRFFSFISLEADLMTLNYAGVGRIIPISHSNRFQK